MEFDAKQHPHLRLWIEQGIEGSLSEADLQQLDTLLCQDTRARRYYLELMFMHAGLRNLLESGETNQNQLAAPSEVIGENMSIDVLIDYLAQEEANAPTLEKKIEPVPQKTAKKTIERTKQSIRFPVFVALTSAAALLLVVIAAQIKARLPRPVATLTDVYQARWSPGPTEMSMGMRLKNNKKPLVLQRGWAQLDFDNGVRVILEGPTELRIHDTNRVVMPQGRLCARVSEQGRGFRVATREATLIDLGTEFGLRAEKDGSLAVQMYDGKAQLQAGRSRTARTRRDISKDQALAVDTAGSIHAAVLDPTAYVRTFSSSRDFLWRGEPVDLADIVAGGSGFGTGTRGDFNQSAQGTINPLTGRLDDPSRLETTIPYDSLHVQAPPGFVPVSDLNTVDGVFVPDVNEGPCIVSSAGHVFAECPDTDGLMKWNICSAWRYWNDSLHTGNTVPELSRRAGISMHANAGITFDLKALRHDLPGLAITDFTAQAGLPLPHGGDAKVDLWVLVEGRVRFKALGLRKSQMVDVRVTLRPTDRFLSLVVTDGRKFGSADYASSQDRCFWADAVLSLAPEPSVPQGEPRSIPRKDSHRFIR